MFYTLPKIWQGRIKKYWDRTIPSNYPASKAKFSLKYKTEEEKEAVEEFEAQLGTEESVVNDLLPEDTFVSGVAGIYDVTGPKGEKILLSPEKVTTDDPFMVLHYENEEWLEVEDVELIDGFIWGTIEDDESTEDEDPGLSPVAVIFYKKDITVDQPSWYANKVVFANGNPISVTTNEDEHIIVINKASGTEIDITEENICFVSGGTSDGTDVENISINVYNVNNENMVIYGGSFFYDEENNTSVKVQSSTVTVLDSTIRGITGGMGAVRIENLNIKADSVKALFVASGQTTLSKINKDANKDLESISLGSAAWVKKATHEITNSEITWYYTGGNSGYSYTVDAEATIKDSNITGGISAGGSNGRSDKVIINVENTISPSYISINRGIVNSVVSKFRDSNITELAVFGNNDEDVTGTVVNEVAIDINDGTYGIIVGKNGDVVSTDASKVRYVKISRSANYTISEDDIDLLGEKFIIK